MELYYRKFGEGPPLIIVHGLYGSSDNWISIGKSLADHFEVFLVDQRNHGRSPHSQTHDYPSLRDDLAGFMDSHQIDKAIFMGHSMGGKAVMYMAESMKERVESLIVIDVAPISYRSAEHLNQFQTHTQILDGMLSVKFNTVHSREDIDTQLARSIYSPKIRSFLLKNVERTSTGEYRWRINVHAIRDQLSEILDGLDPGSFKFGQGITGFPVLFIRGKDSYYITS